MSVGHRRCTKWHIKSSCTLSVYLQHKQRFEKDPSQALIGVNYTNLLTLLLNKLGWSGGAMVLGKLPVPGRPTIWITVGQGPTALTVGAGGCCLDIFTLIYHFFSLSLSFGDGPI